MAISIETIKRGLKKGFETTIYIGKILIPIYFLVTFLKYTPAMGWISHVFKPIMGITGLPGEAALPFVMGNLINLYAGIGAITALGLGIKELTILSVMLSFSHSLILETAVCKKVGVSAVMIIILRLTLAFVSGALLNLIL